VSRRALVVKNAKDGKTIVVGLAADSGRSRQLQQKQDLGKMEGIELL